MLLITDRVDSEEDVENVTDSAPSPGWSLMSTFLLLMLVDNRSCWQWRGCGECHGSGSGWTGWSNCLQRSWHFVLRCEPSLIYPLYFSTVIYRVVWFTAWPLVLRTCKTWKCYRILQLSENVHPRGLRISCLKNFSSYFFYILAVSVNTLVTSMKQNWVNRSVCCFGYELGGLREPLSGGAVILPPAEWVGEAGILCPFWSIVNIEHEPKLFANWQQWCGRLLSVLQQLVVFVYIVKKNRFVYYMRCWCV